MILSLTPEIVRSPALFLSLVYDVLPIFQVLSYTPTNLLPFDPGNDAHPKNTFLLSISPVIIIAVPFIRFPIKILPELFLSGTALSIGNTQNTP